MATKTKGAIRSPELEKAVGVFGSATALADAAGITDQAISDYRANKYNALMGTLEAIVEACVAEKVRQNGGKPLKKKPVSLMKLWAELKS